MLVMNISDDYKKVSTRKCFEQGPRVFVSFLEARLACSSDPSCIGFSGYSSYYTCLGGMSETSENLDATSSTYKKSERFSKYSILMYTGKKQAYDVKFCIVFQ